MFNTTFITYIIILLFLMNACTLNSEDQQVVRLEDQARVTAVECTGQANNYILSVTMESPDIGCEQYADWWEVLYPDSTLIYRRVLSHSHVNEQPFTRSGGVVNVGPDESIIVRAHMNTTGYGSQVFSGNLREGLVLDSLSIDFAVSLANQEPLPPECQF